MTSHLDHHALTSFYDDVGRDREFVVEIVALYRAQVEEFCRDAGGRSREDLIVAAHKLAGSSGQLGLTAVVDAARRLESDLDAGNEPGAELAFLRRELPEVAERLEAWATALPEPPGDQSSGSNR